MDPPGAAPHGVQPDRLGLPGGRDRRRLRRRGTAAAPLDAPAPRRTGAAAGGRRHERAHPARAGRRPMIRHAGAIVLLDGAIVLLDGAIVLFDVAVERSHEPSSAGHPRPYSGSPRASNALRLRTATPAS